MRIAFDIDGVMADFSAASVKVIRELNLVQLPADYVHTNWDFEDILAPGRWRAEVFSHMLAQENAWLKMPAFEDNCEALREHIKAHGEDEICFITSRPPSAGASVQVQTQLWLAEQRLGSLGMPVFVTENAEHKRQVLEGERIQFFLDDMPGNVRTAYGVSNLRTFLLDRPYNRADDDLLRVYSVDEFLLEVEAAEIQ